jgi:EKC/KEOPS complex subunit CGI121/TPRKB
LFCSQISEAYRRYGITPASKDIIVVKVLVDDESSDSERLTAESVEAHLQEHVQGTNTPCTDDFLARKTDWTKIRKYYKLNGVKWLDEIQDESARRHEMEFLVLGGMALRGL